jgi:hypothetical protein
VEPVDAVSEEVIGEVSVDPLGQFRVSVSEHLLHDDEDVEPTGVSTETYVEDCPVCCGSWAVHVEAPRLDLP